MQTDENILSALLDIRNWIRASSHGAVKTALEQALPDSKARMAYQMLDGSTSMDQVRIACKMSPNGLVALAGRCTSMGLMEMNQDKKRVRLFDLSDFGLVDTDVQVKK